MPLSKTPSCRILVLGIYLTDFSNQASRLVRDYDSSTHHEVDQRWAALGRAGTTDPQLAALTVRRSKCMVPKFHLLNEMLAGIDVSAYDYVIFSDDDIVLSPGFMDAYLAWVHHFGFSISQPARTRFSYRDHKFCLQMRGVKARETRFVEIGPVFVFDRAATRSILPFDERSPMGWGCDFVWPVIARLHDLRMGVVDAVPVDHSYRAQTRTYDAKSEKNMMADLMVEKESLTGEQAKVNLEIYR